MSLLERLTHKELLKQYASVVEQILMSGSNMLASIIVLKVGDVAQFGIYSFLFVLGVLISGLFGSLLHRQMMLKIASEEKTQQQQVFLATMAIEMVGLLVFLTLLFLTLILLSEQFGVDTHPGIAASGACYIVLYIVFDAFKQYAYTTGNQIYSLRCTAIYVGIQVVLMAVILMVDNHGFAVEAAYTALAISLLASLISNRLCIDSLLAAQWNSWLFASETLSAYFKQGRFSLFGMIITWSQNQSMNPFLMLISGPKVAGYFSLGRLLVMPLAVVSQGLVNSSTPTLRRLYKESGLHELIPRIRSFLLKTTAFSLLYVSILLIAHFSGWLHRVIPDYESVQWYLLLWIILMSCSIVRFWHGQFFVVSMEFRFLMSSSIIALGVTATGMVLFGIGLGSIKLALMSVICGELTALFLFHRRQTILLQQDQQTNKS